MDVFKFRDGSPFKKLGGGDGWRGGGGGKVNMKCHGSSLGCRLIIMKTSLYNFDPLNSFAATGDNNRLLQTA